MLDVVETVGGWMWFAALVVAFISPAVSFGSAFLYVVLSIAVGGGVLLGGSALARRLLGVEREPEESPSAAEAPSPSEPDEAPAASDDAPRSFLGSFWRTFVEQLGRSNW